MRIHQDENGTISIEISAADLASAVEGGPALEKYDEATGDFKAPIVWDQQRFARDVFAALSEEEEDGTNRVHRMFDEAFKEALEQGADGISVFGEDVEPGEYAKHEAARASTDNV